AGGSLARSNSIDSTRGFGVLRSEPVEVMMSDDVSTFRIAIEIENPERPGDRRTLPSVLVDTGAELSWFPAAVLESLGVPRRKLWRFRQADGSVLERWSGPA